MQIGRSYTAVNRYSYLHSMDPYGTTRVAAQIAPHGTECMGTGHELGVMMMSGTAL